MCVANLCLQAYIWPKMDATLVSQWIISFLHFQKDQQSGQSVCTYCTTWQSYFSSLCILARYQLSTEQQLTLAHNQLLESPQLPLNLNTLRQYFKVIIFIWSWRAFRTEQQFTFSMKLKRQLVSATVTLAKQSKLKLGLCQQDHLR